MSSFTFDFLSAVDDNGKSSVGGTAESSLVGGIAASSTSVSNIREEEVNRASFVWLQDIEAKFRSHLDTDVSIPNELVRLVEGDDQNNESSLRRVRKISTPQQFEDTDLVSGVYEGGLKVWECSVDLCRYFKENHTFFNGFVLEIGCGHGLPGCWVLKQARSLRSKTEVCSEAKVTFTDFNEFVLHGATLPNIIINTKNEQDKNHNNNDDNVKESVENITEFVSWLGSHVALGAGDWKDMSKKLEQKNPSNFHSPSIVPPDGKFDFILAAETTYSPEAAADTAILLSKHLKVGTGIAYIATKRYYFGVGGGSECFKKALTADSLENHLELTTLQVYDNGTGNIRELFKVECSPKDSIRS